MKILPKRFFLQLSLIELSLVFSMIFLQLLLFLRVWALLDEHASQALQWDLAEEVAREIKEEPEPPAAASEAATQILSSFSRANPGTDIFILDSNAAVINSSLPDGSAAGRRIDSDAIVRFLESSAGFSSIIAGTHPISQHERLISAAKLQYSAFDGYVYATLAEEPQQSIWSVMKAPVLGAPALLPWLVLVFTSGWAAIFFLRRKTAAFRRLAPAVQRYAAGDFALRIEGEASGEITEHIAALNGMAAEIEKNIQELEDKDQLQSELIANISHDLRGPMTLIKGYSEELQRSATLDPSKRQRFVETIRSNADSLRKRIEELSDLSAFEERRWPIVLEQFQLREAAAPVLAAYGQEATRQNISFTFHEDPGLPRISADRGLLARVFSNLVENALRYTTAGGTIEIRASLAANGVRCSVKNTGEGIPGADLPRLFERKFQSANQEEPQRGASGLGLSIVRAIIEAHGSAVSVVPVPEGGAEFVFVMNAGDSDSSRQRDLL